MQSAMLWVEEGKGQGVGRGWAGGEGGGRMCMRSSGRRHAGASAPADHHGVLIMKMAETECGSLQLATASSH